LTLAHCLVIYAVLFCALTFPYWGQGEVVAPNRQLIEVGLNPTPGDNENGKRIYGDYIEAFIPAITEHLTGRRSGWLALWSNENELGHPLYHLAGFSAAYFPSWIIAQFTSDPWRFITAFSLFTCFFAGMFLILFCDEMGLSPFAGLIAGVTLSSSPSLVTTLDFPMILSAWCWSAGVLWSATRLSKKSDILSWVVLAFSVYSLAITTVPQLVVFNGYILALYGLYLSYRKQQEGWPETGKFLVCSLSAVIVGSVLTLPIYIDLLGIYADSSRVHTAPSFYMANLPNIGAWSDNFHHLFMNVMPEIFGNPVDPNYPLKNIGLHMTPVMAFFLITGLFVAFKKAWGWWLVIAVFCLLAFVHPLYLFAVKYLGFGLDRSNPLSCTILPIVIVMAFTADTLVRRSRPQELSRGVLLAAACILSILLYGLVIGFMDKIQIHWEMVFILIVLVALLLSQRKGIQPIPMILAMVVVLAAITSPVMLRQHPQDIAKTSPLIEKMRVNMPSESRFAFVGQGLYTLTPNFNAELDLPSIHSYDSLSPQRYKTLIQSLGGEVNVQGRRSTAISPDYDSATFWMSNISLILSPSIITNKDLTYLGEESNIFMYRTASRMGDSVQVTVPSINLGGDDIEIADPRLLPVHTPSKILDKGDELEYAVTPGESSVLVLSQKYYRDWKAEISGPSGWAFAKTVLVNGVFEGVLLPQGAQQVRLEFRPLVRYAWLGHVFWLLMIVVLIGSAGRVMWLKPAGPAESS
jgi:hypothetical protein